MSKNLRFPRINSVTISGRLTRDIDLRYTPSGAPVANLSIAFDRAYNKNGNWEKETSYTDIITWNQTAQKCAEQLTKGSAIIAEGYLRTRTYTNNEGKNVKITEIVANKVHMLEWNDNSDRSSHNEDTHFESQSPVNDYNQEAQKYNQNQSNPAQQSSTTDDVPF